MIRPIRAHSVITSYKLQSLRKQAQTTALFYGSNDNAGGIWHFCSFLDPSIQNGSILPPLRSIGDAGPPLKWMACGPGGIDRQLLRDQSSPISMYDEVVLFEDFIHDHGVVRISVKARVMPRCWYALLRYWLRVDGVVMKVCVWNATSHWRCRRQFLDSDTQSTANIKLVVMVSSVAGSIRQDAPDVTHTQIRHMYSNEHPTHREHRHSPLGRCLIRVVFTSSANVMCTGSARSI